jgi:hypothetical protein
MRLGKAKIDNDVDELSLKMFKEYRDELVSSSKLIIISNPGKTNLSRFYIPKVAKCNKINLQFSTNKFNMRFIYIYFTLCCIISIRIVF